MAKTRKQTYFVDFDRTLSVRNSGDSVFKCGPPIPKMVDYIKRLVAAGEKVVIFTARSGEPQLKPVRKFLEDVGLPGLDITNVKSSRADYFIDDKAKEVIPNTGEFLTHKLREALEQCLYCMEIQEARKTEAFHLNAHAFAHMWGEAKAAARKVIAEVE